MLEHLKTEDGHLRKQVDYIQSDLSEKPPQLDRLQLQLESVKNTILYSGVYALTGIISTIRTSNRLNRKTDIGYKALFYTHYYIHSL